MVRLGILLLHHLGKSLGAAHQVLAEELQKLKKLEKAVRIFASFQMPSGSSSSLK
jgi:hypothetical protein